MSFSIPETSLSSSHNQSLEDHLQEDDKQQQIGHISSVLKWNNGLQAI
jgi:hypothetical protein